MNDIIMLATRLPAGQEAEYRAALAAAMPAETIVPLREADAGARAGPPHPLVRPHQTPHNPPHPR
ncbi:MAG: hypothetical protein V4788_21540, partial [Burkholderia gladioli]